MKKFLLSLFSLVLFFSVVTSVSASAENTVKEKSTPGDITILEEHEVQGIPNASVDFIDPDKVKEGPRVVKTDDVGIFGIFEERYTHSTYTYSHDAVSDYNVGPRMNDKFLLSVATGQTKNLTQSIEIYGTIQYEATVSGSLKQVINLGLTGVTEHIIPGTPFHNKPAKNLK